MAVSALVGAVWAVWHLPLLLTYVLHGEMTWPVATATTVNLLCGALLLGMLRWRSGSVWPAAFGHALMNTLWVFGYGSLVTPANRLTAPAFWAFSALGWVVMTGGAWLLARGLLKNRTE